MSISPSRLFSSLAAAAVATAAIAAAPASAEDVRTMTVSYADLDLGSVAGQKQLSRRIALAATKVCAQPGHGIEAEMDVHQCRLAARSRAGADLAKAGIPGA